MTDISKDSANRNEREELKNIYDRWVEDVCEECDWVTHITQEQVNAKYSEIAINFAISELLAIRETVSDPKVYQKLSARITHLEELVK